MTPNPKRMPTARLAALVLAVAAWLLAACAPPAGSLATDAPAAATALATQAGQPPAATGAPGNDNAGNENTANENAGNENAANDNAGNENAGNENAANENVANENAGNDNSSNENGANENSTGVRATEAYSAEDYSAELEEPEAGEAKLAVTTVGALGKVLVDGQGRTLYLFLNDTPGTSNCSDQCAATWPPLVAEGGQAPDTSGGLDDDLLGTTTRTDGSLQVTYNGWPLYYFAADQKAGDANGQGVGGVWYVVNEAGEAVK